MLTIFQHFGETKVKAVLGTRPGVKRSAKTGACGVPAVDGNQENVFSKFSIIIVLINFAEKNSVLNEQGRELARPNAQEGVLGCCGG